MVFNTDAGNGLTWNQHGESQYIEGWVKYFASVNSVD